MLNDGLKSKVNNTDSRLSDPRTPKAHTHGWSTITGKPSSYPPTDHNHDGRYYTEAEMNSKLSAKAGLSSSNIFREHNSFTRSVGAGANSWITAPILIEAPYDIDKATRPGIGFNLSGSNAAFLCLCPDGKLRLINNSGTSYIINMTAE